MSKIELASSPISTYKFLSTIFLNSFQRFTGGLKLFIISHECKSIDKNAEDDEGELLLKRIQQTMFFGILLLLPMVLPSMSENVFINLLYPFITLIIFLTISMYQRYKANILKTIVNSVGTTRKSDRFLNSLLKCLIIRFNSCKKALANKPIKNRITIFHIFLLPTHATSVSVATVYLLKTHEYNAYLYSFLLFTVASCHFSLIKVPDNLRKTTVHNNSKDGQNYTRSSYFILCVGLLAVQDILRHFLRRVTLELRYLSSSFSTFDINQGIQYVLLSFIALLSVFFTFELLPDIKEMYNFIVFNSSEPEPTAEPQKSTELSTTLFMTNWNEHIIKLLLSLFKKEFMNTLMLMLFYGGVSYLVIKHAPRRKDKIWNSVSYSLFYSLICIISFWNFNSLIKFSISLAKRFLGITKINSHKHTTENEGKNINKQTSHKCKKEAFYLSFLLFLEAFIISFCYLIFRHKLIVVKNSLVYIAIIFGLIDYPIIKHQYCLMVNEAIKNLIVFKYLRKNKKFRVVVKYAEILYNFCYSYLIIFPFLLLCLIDSVEELILKETNLIIAMTIVSSSGSQFERAFEDPNSISNTLTIIGLFYNWDIKKLSFCNAIDTGITNDIIQLIFAMKRQAKVLLANIYSNSSRKALIPLLFYVLNLNPYSMLVLVVSLFPLNFYSFYGGYIFLPTFQKTDRIPIKYIKDNKEQDEEFKFILNIVRANLFQHVKDGKFGSVQCGDIFCFNMKNKRYLLKINKIAANKIRATLNRIPEELKLESDDFGSLEFRQQIQELIKYSFSNLQSFPFPNKWYLTQNIELENISNEDWRSSFDEVLKQYPEDRIGKLKDTNKEYLKDKLNSFSHMELYIEKMMQKYSEYKINNDPELKCSKDIASDLIAILWLTILHCKQKWLGFYHNDYIKIVTVSLETRFSMKIMKINENKRIFCFTSTIKVDRTDLKAVKVNPNYLYTLLTSIDMFSSSKEDTLKQSAYLLNPNIMIKKTISELQEKLTASKIDLFSDEFVSYRRKSVLSEIFNKE